MIDVSKEVKQAYENSTTQIDKIILDKQEYRITNVEYYDDCYDEGNVFGTAIVCSIPEPISLLNFHSEYSEFRENQERKVALPSSLLGLWVNIKCSILTRNEGRYT